MTDEERLVEIKRGWVTNYPNPDFTGDKIELLCSIDAAHKDITFLLEQIDILAKKDICFLLNQIVSAKKGEK